MALAYVGPPVLQLVAVSVKRTNAVPVTVRFVTLPVNQPLEPVTVILPVPNAIVLALELLDVK